MVSTYLIAGHDIQGRTTRPFTPVFNCEKPAMLEMIAQFTGKRDESRSSNNDAMQPESCGIML
jgi:hypothetical protein